MNPPVATANASCLAPFAAEPQRPAASSASCICDARALSAETTGDPLGPTVPSLKRQLFPRPCLLSQPCSLSGQPDLQLGAIHVIVSADQSFFNMPSKASKSMLLSFCLLPHNSHAKYNKALTNHTAMAESAVGSSHHTLQSNQATCRRSECAVARRLRLVSKFNSGK